MIRRSLTVILSAVLIGSSLSLAVPASENTEKKDKIVPGVEEGLSSDKKSKAVSVSGESFPFYVYDLEDGFELPVYFVDDTTDLPFVDLKDWADLMVTTYHMLGYADYALYYEKDDGVLQYSRENDYTMLFDFDEGEILFEDYDAFTHVPGDSSLLDMISSDSCDSDGNSLLFERIEKGSFDRYGKEIELNLKNYDIPMYWIEEEDLYLVPLQTMGDFLLSAPLGFNSFFNGEAVYLTSQSGLGLDVWELTPIGESYYSAPYGNMSEPLAWFNYCELCLALDNLYGLKEIHDITTFDRVFTETGYKADLCSTDPNIADGALNDFIYYYLDDLHSGFSFYSYRTEEMETIGGTGLSSQLDSTTAEIYSAARENAEREIVSYEEVGNTAYITFDGFHMYYQPSEYYSEDLDVERDPSDGSLDTIALLIYAHKQICREDSPVENVVIDLSLNGGGALDAAAFVCAWFLGETSVSIRSSLTGAVSTGKYRADVNLDGVFDEKDTVMDKNLYCLIGPYSFSCGNLVPSIFKSSQRVILLGHESGGGSCSILPMSTACGATFQISSPFRMSYLKNGSYYDIDRGIEPDCYIVKPESFYDREALTEYINNLF